MIRGCVSLCRVLCRVLCMLFCFMCQPEDTRSGEMGMRPDAHAVLSGRWGGLAWRMKGVVWFCIAMAAGYALGLPG